MCVYTGIRTGGGYISKEDREGEKKKGRKALEIRSGFFNFKKKKKGGGVHSTRGGWGYAAYLINFYFL